MAIYSLERGAAGLPFTNFYDADSGILKETPSVFPQGGQAIFRIAGEEEQVTTDGTGNTFGGVQILNAMGLEKHEGDCVAFMKRGQIWVPVSEEVQAGDAVTYDNEKKKFGKSGSITINGKFKTNGTADGLAIIEFDAV